MLLSFGRRLARHRRYGPWSVRPRAPRHLRRRRGPRPGCTYGAQRRTAASEDRDDEDRRKPAPSPRSPSQANTNHFLAGTS